MVQCVPKCFLLSSILAVNQDIKCSNPFFLSINITIDSNKECKERDIFMPLAFHILHLQYLLKSMTDE